MLTAVTNSSPLIALSMIGQIDLLFEIFHKVYIPEAVYHEVASSESRNQHGRKDAYKRFNTSN
jgi:predicted nucleic acid-binding protein